MLVDHSTLDLVPDSNIEQITISDHSPITLSFTLPHAAAKMWSWRLNENLVDDVRVVAGVTEILPHNSEENATGEVNEGVLWEGHKAVV